MTTIDVRPVAGRRGSRALLRGTQALLGVFGAVKLAGTVYFTFFATAEQGGDPQGAADWSVVAWSALLAVAFLGGAFLLASDRRVLPALVAVIALDLVFSAVKLVAYDEAEALGFMAISLVILALLALIARGRRS